MSQVEPRDYIDFSTRKTIVEKVVERRLGHYSLSPPDGWKWDHRYISDYKNSETLPFPGLKKSHLLRLDRKYWQNGPIAGSKTNALKVTEIKEIYSGGITKWAPVIHNGSLSIWRDSTYLFSDDSVVEIVSASNIDNNSKTYHTLQKTLRPSSPITATIFKRSSSGEFIPWRNYKHKARFTGLFDSAGNKLTTVSGSTIYWDNVDTAKREFISFTVDQKIKLLFNKDVKETITKLAIPINIKDFNDYEYLGTTNGTDGQLLETSVFPVSRDNSLKVYVVNTLNSTWIKYSVVTSFTGTNQVILDEDFGVLKFGTSGSSCPPPSKGSSVYIAYNAVPRIEYEEDNYSDVCVAGNADVNPLRQSINKGFVTLSRTKLDIASIVLETTKGVFSEIAATHGPVYIGSDYAPLTATVYSSSGEVIPNAEVIFYFETTSPFGGLGGNTTFTQRKTAASGKAKTFYVPPSTVDSMGFYVSSVSYGDTLVLPEYANFIDTDDIYTYYVLKDDPLIGVVGADTSIGEVEWNPSLVNGRKVILYKWYSDAVNPITGYYGAYAPIRPTNITSGYILEYPDALAAPDITSSTTNLGAYWVVSDRSISIRASVYSPKLGRTIYSNVLNLRVQIPEYMKGSYIKSNLEEVPFGWRIVDDTYEQASALNGATFISINPIAGPYPIIDVIAGEQWDYSGDPDSWWPYNGYPGEGASQPFAHFSLMWEVV